MICICFFKMPYLTFVRSWTLRLNLANAIWWWQLWWRDEWKPTLTTKFGWEEKIKLIKATDLPWMRVGSLIVCCSPNWDVMASILEPSKVVISSVYQLLDFPLKSLMATIYKGLVAETTSRVSSKLLPKFSKLSLDWFGDLYKETKLQILSPSFITKVIYSLR